MRTYEIGIGAFSAASQVVKQSLITRFIERIDRSSFRESGWDVPTNSSLEWVRYE